MRHILVMLLFMGLCGSAQASFVSDFIEDAGNNLNPQYYESSKRGYATFGSFTTRVKRSTLNPIAITPPQVDIGCGGIDVISGGFSFAKGSEIVHLFKDLSKQAPFVAASLTMKTLCNECADTVSEIMNYVQKLNAFQLDSCSIAEGAVQAVYDVGSGASSANDLKNRAMNHMKSGFTGSYEQAVNEAKSQSVINKEINALNFSAAEYLATGGSLLDYVYNKWAKSGASLGKFTFPHSFDVAQVRALYGDVFRITAQDSYTSVSSCGKSLNDMVSAYYLKANAVNDCTANSSSTIEYMTTQYFNEIIEAYITGSDPSAQAQTLMLALSNTNVGSIIRAYAKSGDAEYLRSIAPLVQELAIYELAYVYTDLYYQELIPILSRMRDEASVNAGAFSESLSYYIYGLINRVEHTHTVYIKDYYDSITPLYNNLKMNMELRQIDLARKNPVVKSLENK